MYEDIIARYKKAGIEIPKEFYDANVIEMLGSENTFMWENRKYRFLACNFGPTITMKCVDDDSRISFNIISELKDELIKIN